jgi:hypothetical protein
MVFYHFALIFFDKYIVNYRFAIVSIFLEYKSSYENEAWLKTIQNNNFGYYPFPIE